MSFRLSTVLMAISFAAAAKPPEASRCDQLLAAFGSRLADATCVESPDLTTNNPNTTPQNNSIPGLPPLAFTPQTDRATIAPDAAHKTPITKVVPGVQLNGRIADDP